MTYTNTFVTVGRKLRDLRKKFQDELANASNVAEEAIGNIRTVRSFNGENKTMSLYGDMIENSYALGRKLAFYTGLFNFDQLNKLLIVDV